ncbi:hypothetical protein [Paenibacillus profundus]|uniref:hypothetical protein n=1 Tax=Paenibacillus profundus TaxID=1173085 RepID=UPI001F28E2E0|nr:hypothetical protein [Paenibacillus profundus]
MEHNDWNDFRANVTWFIQAKDTVEIEDIQEEGMELTAPFQEVFPQLSTLLAKARVTNVTRPWI